jgi:hypothetical protein
MTKWYAVVAILVLVIGACGDADADDEDAAGATLPPTSTASVTPTPSVTLTRTATVAASPGAGPTVAQLQRALLTAADLEPSWIAAVTGTRTEAYPAVFAEFVKAAVSTGLSVELHDARTGVPDFRALAFLDDLTVSQLTQEAPPAFGADGVRYRYAYEEAGLRWYGEVVAWRQGAVVVALLVEDVVPGVCVCDIATRQFDKLAATIH